MRCKDRNESQPQTVSAAQFLQYIHALASFFGSLFPTSFFFKKNPRGFVWGGGWGRVGGGGLCIKPIDTLAEKKKKNKGG